MRSISSEPERLTRACRSERPLAIRACRDALPTCALLLASGCASYERLPLDGELVVAQLAERPTAELDVEAATDWLEDWFPFATNVRYDDGVTLAEANVLALLYSPRVRAARSEEGVSAALVVQSGVLSNPQLFLGPMFSTEGSSTIFPASLTWQLPLWGQVDAREESALADLSVAQLAVVDVELSALREVRAAFLRLERRRREVEAFDSVVSFSTQLVRWVEELGDAGEASPSTVYLVRAERDAALAALERARAMRIGARSRLLELLGLLPDAEIEFTTEGANVMPSLPEESEGNELLRVPALRQAHASYEASEAALKLAVRQQYPSVRVGLQYEGDRGEPFLGPGLSLSLPLFDRNEGGIEAARRARELARQRYEAELLRVSHGAARSRASADAAESIVRAYREGSLRDADDALVALEQRLRLGHATALEAVATQSAVARSRARLLELEEQLYVSRFDLALASGHAFPPMNDTNPSGGDR